jgi:hypothetical protein
VSRKAFPLELTEDQTQVAVRALALAQIYYTRGGKMPSLRGWRPSERAMAAVESEELRLALKAAIGNECPKNDVSGKHVQAPLDRQCIHCGRAL